MTYLNCTFFRISAQRAKHKFWLDIYHVHSESYYITNLHRAHVSSNLLSIWRFWISSARFLLLDPDQTWRGNHYFRWRNPPNLLELCGPWVWRPNKNFRKKNIFGVVCSIHNFLSFRLHSTLKYVKKLLLL